MSDDTKNHAQEHSAALALCRAVTILHHAHISLSEHSEPPDDIGTGDVRRAILSAMKPTPWTRIVCQSSQFPTDSFAIIIA
ncbi:hypothetical protein T01_15378 [Trichinella spiralis]|uniref:Uncharacterized protein n=1 Tax=Trichinella spiralis TaxID=6334 RepID=A0A0V1B299_TRISP|nr:hypothetical protein T01_15378 [Trichinella spiralis]